MNKAERLNQELLFLTDKSSFQLQDIMNQFSISRKTAWRDLQELENLGLAFYTERGRGGKYQVINEKLLTRIYFSNDEINAIFFALKALEQMSTTPFSGEYKQIYRKLFKSLSPKRQAEISLQQRLVNYRQQPSLHQVKYFALLLEAVIKNQCLKIETQQYFSERETIQVYEIFYQTGNWFCHIYNLKQDRFFILRCDKMTFCQKAGPAELDHQQLTQKLLVFKRHFYNIDFACELSEHNQNLFLLNPYPEMKIVKEGQQIFLKGKANQSELDYLANFLINLGQGVKILYPQELKIRYLAVLQKMYEQNFSPEND